ncbi:glycoside hydrolase family 18 protein [Diplodia corticola]|uniref:chitinase n=1 Tax=Diplodia corticola TaxID=236234 RepID=A0A1J9RSA2_9PEZI|nr:glycoside hydrolase family 18 protein [Diplodia corticola]OJD31319.1 glycoside hydrolase family 18 protein [Diplodia corticola]
MARKLHLSFFLLLQFLFFNQAFAYNQGCQSNCEQGSSEKSASNVQQRLVGYYPAAGHDAGCLGMDFDSIPAERFTHLNFAFGRINSQSFEIEPAEGLNTDAFSNLTSLKNKSTKLKAMISLTDSRFGPNNRSVFSNMISSRANRQKFIERLTPFMGRYCFDGVDFDWEYPGEARGSDDDGVNYTQLLKELRDTMKGYVVSFTAPTPLVYLRHFDLRNMMQYVDFVNFMAYDIHGVWDRDPDSAVGNHIYAHTNLTEIKDALDILWRADVPRGKVNLGLAFYGNSYTLENSSCSRPGCPFKDGGTPGPCSGASGVLIYKEIVDIINTNNIKPVHDTKAAVKYITWNADQWVAYDDPETLQQKIRFGNEQGLGGLFIWAINQDVKDRSALRGVLAKSA